MGGVGAAGALLNQPTLDTSDLRHQCLLSVTYSAPPLDIRIEKAATLLRNLDRPSISCVGVPLAVRSPALAGRLSSFNTAPAQICMAMLSLTRGSHRVRRRHPWFFDPCLRLTLAKRAFSPPPKMVWSV